MLSSVVVQEINHHLQQGEVTAALAPLELAVDVRTRELPAVEKATLAALGRHLQQNHEAARILAEAALHPNISVRRFVRKLVQGLKESAAPVAKPLRACIQQYLEETIALDYTFNPQEAALRREQADVLNTSIELLRRCDLNEFLGYLGVLLMHWHGLREAEKEATQPQDEVQKNYGEAIVNQWKVVQRRTNEIFAERYAHLGLNQFEFQQTSSRLWDEFQEIVQNDPEVLAAQPPPFEIPVFTRDTTPKTLMEQPYNVSRAFANALALNFVWQPDKKPGAGQGQIRDTLWRWLEEAICTDNPEATARVESYGWVSASNYFRPQWLAERAIPLLIHGKEAGRAGTPAWDWLLSVLASCLSRHTKENVEWPPGVTPEAVRALKRDDKRSDHTLDEIALKIEAQQASRSTPATAAADEDDDEDENEDEDDAPAIHEELAQLLGTSVAEYAEAGKTVRRAAATFNSMEERLEALVNPPLVKQRAFFEVEESPVPRDELLKCWRKTKEWQEQEASLREAALPRLFDKLQEVRAEYIAAGKRTTPVSKKMNEAIAATLTDKEKKEWQRKKAEEEEFELMVALDDVINGIEELGGLSVQPRILDLIIGDGKEHYYSRHLIGTMDGLGQRETFESSDLPIMRDICARWSHHCATLDESQDKEWRLGWSRQALARALYMAGSTVDQAEARLLVQSSNLFHSDLARIARERGDAEIFTPLLRNIMHFYDNNDVNLIALWDDIRANQPEQIAVCVPEMLDMIAAAPDAKQARPVLEMLEKLAKDDAVFARHFNLLVRCAESTVPQIARFGFEGLAHIEAATQDWSTLCEHAGEKLWSDNAGLAKDAARFLGAAGTRDEAAAPMAWTALGDALSLNAVPLLEAALRAMTQIKAKQDVEVDETLRARLQELKAEYSSRLGKLCDRLL